MQVTCVYRDKEVENCTEPLEGTIAKIRCAPFYEDLQLKRRPVHICNDGTWDQPLPQCEPGKLLLYWEHFINRNINISMLQMLYYVYLF